jgi:hypothetical protein
MTAPQCVEAGVDGVIELLHEVKKHVRSG